MIEINKLNFDIMKNTMKKLLCNTKLLKLKNLLLKKRKDIFNILFGGTSSIFIYLGVVQKNILYFIIGMPYIIVIIYILFKLIYYLIKLGYYSFKLANNKDRLKRGIDIVIFIAILLAIVSGIMMYLNIFKLQNYNPDFGGLVGGAISGIATLLVIRLTLLNESRHLEEKARISAGILQENISSVWEQLNSIDFESRIKIAYLDNWMDYYRDVTYITSNNYITTLMNEFRFVDRINSYIHQGQKEKALNTLKQRRLYNQNYTGAYNITDVYSNFGSIKLGHKERESWMFNEENIKLIKQIESKCYDIVENKIYKILKERKECEFSDIQNELIGLLRTFDEFKNIYENRILVQALLNICIKFNKMSHRIEFVWNQLFLKSENK